MGKLGGGELNYSSDIDLILLYDTSLLPPAVLDDAQTLFTRLARELVRILDERTGDGYVFRTDLRLRPDPRSTPLAISVAAALTYYETVGQNWERAALIKARPVAGDDEAGLRFLAELQPFIWRKNLDFAAIRGYPLDQAPDSGAQGRRANRRRRPRHQDRPRRHSRNRVFRPDPAIDLGRPDARIAGRADLHGAATASPPAARSTRRRPRP